MINESRMESFISYFEQQPGIDQNRTNHALINALFLAWNSRDLMSGVIALECSRNSGVTTTLIAFAQWIDAPILVVTSKSNLKIWKRIGIDARTWNSSLLGIVPRPEIVLIDSPISEREFKSAVTMFNFSHWLKRFPYPALFPFVKFDPLKISKLIGAS